MEAPGGMQLKRLVINQLGRNNEGRWKRKTIYFQLLKTYRRRVPMQLNPERG